MARRDAAQHVTERDRALLHWIGLAGIATDDQVARRFWAGQRAQTARDRLAQLVKAGYLAADTCDARGPEERVYTLTDQGRQQFTPSERARLRVGLPAPHERPQQLLAQEAYLRLDEEARIGGGHLAHWRTEHEVRGEFRRAQHAARHAHQPAPHWEIADGQAVVVSATGEVQEIDVEIDGQYYGQMLRQKVARFGQGGRPTVWVCTASRARAVQRATQAYRNIRVVVVKEPPTERTTNIGGSGA